MTILFASKSQVVASPVLAAVVALAASTAVLAEVPERGSAKVTRPCEGRVTTLFWGAYVRDARGPCVAAAEPIAEWRPLVARRVEVAVPDCEDERRWLGGALRICRDAPRTQEPR